MAEIAIDPSRCKKDGLCAIVCPAKRFVQREKATIPELIEAEECIACGHCLAICPSGAISHSAFPAGGTTPIELERMPSHEQVLELLRSRRSIRAFRDQPLAKETIEQIIDGARFAPSAHNSQTTRYLVVVDKAVLERVSAVTVDYMRFEIKRLNGFLLKALGSLLNRELLERGLAEIPLLERVVRRYEDGGDPILNHAPALLVFHARRNVTLADVNAQLALQNASLVAHSLGVGHFYTGFALAACKAPMARDWRRRIPDLIGIPAKNAIHGALALGYPLVQYKNWIERKPARVEWV